MSTIKKIKAEMEEKKKTKPNSKNLKKFIPKKYKLVR